MLETLTTSYTIREPGCTAWEGPGLGYVAAWASLRQARANGLHRARVWTDTDPPQDVTPRFDDPYDRPDDDE